MKKALTSLALLLLLVSAAKAQVVISEIMYNPPESGTDSLEYIEIMNPSANVTVNLEGWSFGGVDLVLTGVTLPPQGYLLVALNASAIQHVFGKTAIQWTANNLSNSGEILRLINPQGVAVDSVKYDDANPWPTDAAGNGPSLELCNPLSDNYDVANWRAGSNNTNVVINGKTIYATPGAANTASCLPVADHIVTVQNFFFAPADITINQGESVLWNNTGGTHNVNGSLATFPQNPAGFFSGPAMPAPWIFIDTFNVPGVYSYRCDPHAAQGMNGKITVLAAQIPNIQITEIMYNNPGTDSLEFVEIYNNGAGATDISGWSFTQGIEHVFPAGTSLGQGQYIVLAKYPDQILSKLGVSATKWDLGDLVNSGEDLELRDASNNVIDYVDYKPSDPWPSDANGGGPSLVLCDFNTDNGLPANWQAAATATNVVINNITVLCNPAAASQCPAIVANNYPVRTIEQMIGNNVDGVADSVGIKCSLEGVVHGVNLKFDGLNFYIINPSNTAGINVFKNTGNLGYTVQEGDKVKIKGKIAQFNGLREILPDSIFLLSSGNPTVTPALVALHSEATESRLIQIKKVMFVDVAEWTTGVGTSGFNVRAISPTAPNDTILIRIDNDVDLYNLPAPSGVLLTVTGIGGQYDNSAPYTSGYQITPRYQSDIIEFSDATHEADFSANVRLSPNPVSGQLNIVSDLAFDQIQIFTAAGQLAKSIQQPNFQEKLDTKTLESGVYFVRFTKDGAAWTTRFVKM